MQWIVDTIEDFTFTWKEVLHFLENTSEWLEINWNAKK